MTIRVLSLIILIFASISKPCLATDYPWLYEGGECELKANGEIETIDECIQRSINERVTPQDHDNSYYTLSFCSGLGATDRMLLKNGFRIVASVDMDAQRNKLNNINNNDCLSEDFKYKVITGNITTEATRNAVLKAVKDSKAKDLSSISLVYTFVAEGIGVNSSAIINSVLNICGYSTEIKESDEQEKEEEENLYNGPKIICFELLENNKFFDNSSVYHKSNSYHFMCSKEETGQCFVKFEKLGLPVANHRRMAYFVRKDVTPNKNELSPLKFWSNSYEKKSVVEALKITLPNSPYGENDKWWEEKYPDGSNIVAHDLPYLEEHIKLQEEFISHIPGKGVPKGSARNGSIFQVLNYPGEKDEKIWRLAEDSQLRTITSMALQPLRNIHPTQPRALTLLELCVLHGMLELGSFNLTLEEENDITPKSIIERVAALTPPTFLEIVFESISGVLGGKNTGVIMNTDNLCPYFISESLEKHKNPTGCKPWIYLRDHPQFFHEKKENDEARFQGPLPSEMPAHRGAAVYQGVPVQRVVPPVHHVVPAHSETPVHHEASVPYGTPVHYGIQANHGMQAPQMMPVKHGMQAPQMMPVKHGMQAPQMMPVKHGMQAPQMMPVKHGMQAPQMMPANHGMQAPQMMPVNHGMQAPQMMPMNHGMQAPQMMPMNHGMQAPQMMPMNHGMQVHQMIPMNHGMPVNLGIQVNLEMLVNSGMLVNLGGAMNPGGTLALVIPINLGANNNLGAPQAPINDNRGTKRPNDDGQNHFGPHKRFKDGS